MPNTQVVFYSVSTGTVLATGGGAAIIKLNGVTIDTQGIIGGIGTSTGSITSNAIVSGNTYTVTCTGAGAPSGTYTLYATPVYPAYADNSTYTTGSPIYTIFTGSTVTTTSAPATAALPSPNPNIQTSFITIYNTATASTLPAGITCTIAPSGGGATVDTQVTNASGQITSTKLNTTSIYQVTFSGTGAPTGTYIFDPNTFGNNAVNTLIV